MTTVPDQIELRQSRDFSGVITAVFTFIRENFKLFFKSILYIVGPPSLVGSLLLGGSVSVSGLIAGSATGILGIISGFLLLLLSWTLTIAVVNSFVFLYMERGRDNFELQDVWQETRSNLGNVVGTSLWLVVLGIGAYFVFGFSAIFSLILGVFAGLALLVLVVYFVVALIPIYTVRLYEDVALMESVTRSRELTRGHWWLSFGVFAVPYVITLLTSYLLAVPSYVIEFGSDYVYGRTDGEAIIAIFFAVLSTFATVVLTAVPVLAATFQYFNLVEKLDGVGVMSRIEQMGNEQEETGAAVEE